MEGYLLIHRKIDKWEWRSDPKMFSVFMYCLTNASFKDHRWKGHEIKKGSFPTGRKKIALETGLSERSVRTALDKLISTKEIAKERIPGGSIITVVKYGHYQGATSDLADERPTTDQRPTNDRPHRIKGKERVIKGEQGEIVSSVLSDTVSPKPPKVTGVLAWKAYSNAFKKRYGTEPLRNATVNAQLLNFTKRVGIEDAPFVAEFYVSHNNGYYTQRGHSVAQMLLDAEKLYMEWKTNRNISAKTSRANDIQENLITMENPYGNR